MFWIQFSHWLPYFKLHLENKYRPSDQYLNPYPWKYVEIELESQLRSLLVKYTILETQLRPLIFTNQQILSTVKPRSYDTNSNSMKKNPLLNAQLLAYGWCIVENAIIIWSPSACKNVQNLDWSMQVRFHELCNHIS